MGTHTKFRDSFTGIVVQNVPFFTLDIISTANIDRGSTKFLISIQLSTESVIQATVDNVLYGDLNELGPLLINKKYEFGIRVKYGAKFNLRASDASGATITLCEIHEDDS